MPKFIDPLSLADKNANLEGVLPFNTLDRLRELLVNDAAGEISVSLHFGKQGKLAKIEGHISAVLPVKCQRCLDAVEWVVNSDIRLGIVSSPEQASKLPEDLEPLLMRDQEKIDLKDIIEDEILILLPDVPKHAEECGIEIPLNAKQQAAAQKTDLKPTNNPFSILADIKKPETSNGSTKK